MQSKRPGLGSLLAAIGREAGLRGEDPDFTRDETLAVPLSFGLEAGTPEPEADPPGAERR